MIARLIFLLCLCAQPALGMSAKSYIVTDMDGNVLAESYPDVQRPIASITKLMTTERNSALAPDELIMITAQDVHAGKMRSSPLRSGMLVPRSTLIELALVSSDNIAAIALGRSDSAQMYLPPNTRIVEASGLDAGNVSTARELSEIARTLYHSRLAGISVRPTVAFNKQTRRSTNPLLTKPGWDFFLSKTGFTNPAGGCLVVITKIAGQQVAVVILGARDTKQRWADLVELRKKLGDTDFYVPTKKLAWRKVRR